MSEDLMLKCLIAFILGWFVSRMMGNGFSVGGVPEGETKICINECTRLCNIRGDNDCFKNCSNNCKADQYFYQLFNEEGKCNNGDYYETQICKDPKGCATCKECISYNLDHTQACWCKSNNNPGHVTNELDPNTNCTTCKDPLLEPSTDCTKCKNPEHKKFGNKCICNKNRGDHYDLNDCTQCKNKLYDPDSNCLQCKNRNLDRHYNCSSYS